MVKIFPNLLMKFSENIFRKGDCMYNIKLENYVPKPQPAKSDKIVAAHYYGAWKKGAAGLHDGFEDLHNFPERTPLMGYYDEENPQVYDWQIKWAVEHGINCFIHCWYRKKENMGKPVTLDALRCVHSLHEALFNAKYQDMMKFAIMFEASGRWCGTDKDDMIENLMPFWMDTYFKRENYLVIDNKPVLFIYGQFMLQELFSSEEEQKETFDKCREYCKKCGFDGMIIAACVNTDLEKDKEADIYTDLMNRGYDFFFNYRFRFKDDDDSPENILKSYRQFCERCISFAPKSYVPIASCFWDPTPRTTQKWKDMGVNYFPYSKLWRQSPEHYREMLKICKELSDNLPEDSMGRRMVMIDNWNEWDEGHYVAPNHEFGFKYLQAIREELTQRDNLPDYRTPQELGFTDHNKSWTEPDLRKICEEKFDVR